MFKKRESGVSMEKNDGVGASGAVQNGDSTNTVPRDSNAPQPSRRSSSGNDAQQQILALKEQMEQIQLNGINTQAHFEAQLRAALGQLQSATEQLQSARDELDANEDSGSPYLKTSTALRVVGAIVAAFYIMKTLSSKKVSTLSYSKSLRHAHLLMGIGVMGGIGSVQVARKLEPGPEKKKYMDFHKGSGVVMLAGILLRIVLRLRSAIPERFPSNRPLKFLETLSHRGFYVLMLMLPASGIAYNYCSGIDIPFLGLNKPDLEEEDILKAQQAMDLHKKLGQFLEYVWVPFHFLTMAYHSARGRGVIRKITPFP